jgi:hypothetical protein
VYFLSNAGRIACKDVGLLEAFSCPWPLSLTFYKLLEIERSIQPVKVGEMGKVVRELLSHIDNDPLHTAASDLTAA